MISPELRARVRAYAESQISTRELEDWLAPRIGSLIADPDSDDADLVAAIMLVLSEMTDGIRSLGEGKAYLAEELAHYPSLMMERITHEANITCSSETVESSFSPWCVIPIIMPAACGSPRDRTLPGTG